MSAPGIRLGVDFGTSNTVAVMRWPDGRARPLLFDGSPLLPSAVYAEPGGALVVGRDAVHSARLEPSRFEPNPKRRIDDGTVLLGDRELPVGQLVTAVLARVAEELRRAAGTGDVEVTITCPASWGATRRLVLADAARVARLGEVRLVAEPVAAATYYTRVLGREVPIGSVVVVHDFGAGTFDASVVARTSTGFEVLAVDGCDDVGGLDVDEVVIRHIAAACADRDPAAWQRLVSPATVEDRRARRLLWDDARVAKERLSRSTSADLTVPLVGTDVHLTRAELEDLARPLIEQTVRVTEGVLRFANIADGRLAGVFLVGGSSRIPLVATLLHRTTGEAPVVIEQPEMVVAEGSVLAGAAAMARAAGPPPGPATGELETVALRRPVPEVTVRRPARPPAPPADGSADPESTVPVPSLPVPAMPVPSLPVPTMPVPMVPKPATPAPAVMSRTMMLPAQPANRQPVRHPPATPARPAPVSPAAQVYQAYQEPAEEYFEPRSSLAARLLRALLLILLLVAVPMISAYVAYRLTLVLGI